MRSGVAFAACLLALVGCGGGGDGGSSALPPPAPQPPPASPTPPPVIGKGGGTLTETTGAKVIFPAGAVKDDTTFRIAADSTGAPPIPANLAAAGSVYVVTPHGGQFAKPVEVSIPVPAVALMPNQALKLAKAEPGGTWEILGDSEVIDGRLKAGAYDFSYFTAIVITYPLPILEREPFRWNISVTCGDQDCNALVGPATITHTVTSNNGQLGAPCDEGVLVGAERDMVVGSGYRVEHEYPLSGGSTTTTLAPPDAGYQV